MSYDGRLDSFVYEIKKLGDRFLVFEQGPDEIHWFIDITRLVDTAWLATYHRNIGPSVDDDLIDSVSEAAQIVGHVERRRVSSLGILFDSHRLVTYVLLAVISYDV